MLRRVLTGLAGVSVTAAGLVAAPATALAAPPCGQEATSPTPPFFSDEAVQPPVATPDRPNHYTLTAHNGTHSFHSQWAPVPTYGYSTAKEAMDYLGPIIVTERGRPVDLTIRNGITKPLFSEMTNTDVVLHRHGGLQPPDSDGTPEQAVPPGGARTNHYPNVQAAAPLWYHDHILEGTSYNVYGGLAGYMPNTDAIEPRLNLPTGQFAKAFMLQDKSFNRDYTLCYTHDSPEFFGDLPVVNGTIAPKQTVEPRRYTFTFVNGSDSRFYHLSLTPAPGTAGAAPAMTVVGSDSGYLLRPARVDDLLIAPGERYRVVVDFTGRTGQWILSNDAATPYPEGDDSIAAVPQIMRFDVGAKASSADRSGVPPVIVETNNVLPAEANLATARLRTVQTGETAPGAPLLGDATALHPYADKATETPQLGSTEAWAMRNHSPDTHPIHEHLVELYLVGRWHVDEWSAQDEKTGNAVPLKVGAFQPPGAWEAGPKDTFVTPTDSITVWVGRYTVEGRTVWHCHILSHEDRDMMRPLEVGNAVQSQLPIVGTQARLDQLIRQP